MRKLLTALGTCTLLVGCAGGRAPASNPLVDDPRAPCDSYAARAIRVEDLGEATSWAARAAECYSDLRNQSGAAPKQ